MSSLHGNEPVSLGQDQIRSEITPVYYLMKLNGELCLNRFFLNYSYNSIIAVSIIAEIFTLEGHGP